MSTLRIPANENDHVQGRASAPVTLAEYGDCQCLVAARQMVRSSN